MVGRRPSFTDSDRLGSGMSGAATILIAREDLSIPGEDLHGSELSQNQNGIETRFFNLLRENRPDVVVLDLSPTEGAGVAAIRKIRQHSAVPILVVCRDADPRLADYRIAGAAECLLAPTDILMLSRTIQNILRVNGRNSNSAAPPPDEMTFAGITYRPAQNVIWGGNGVRIQLTTSENDLLSYFLRYAGLVRTRAEIADVLYGRHRPNTDRAVDVVVNRLRKKLAAVGDATEGSVVKTEFRKGYVLIADVSTVPRASS